MTNTELIMEAYKIIGNLTPLRSDCGRLCGAACCNGDEDTGMLLLPGEEELLQSAPGFTVKSADGHRLLVCNGQCQREYRPLSCRIFPLAIVNDNGRTKVIPDPRSIPLCPLYRKALDDRLDPAFKKAVKSVAKLFSQSPEMLEFMKYLFDICSQTESLYKDLL